MRILVVGGGITGLAAAWQAVNGGNGHESADVLLAEASPEFGGKLQTERHDGFLIEHGPDSFLTRPATVTLLHELGLGERLLRLSGPRTVHLRRGGRLRPIPATMGLVLPRRLGPLIGTAVLTPFDKARAALDLVLPRSLPESDVAVGRLLRRRLGDGFVDHLVQPMLGGVHGAGVDELSLDAVAAGLREDVRTHRSLLLATWSRSRSGAPQASPPEFATLRDGTGELVAALVKGLTERGVTLRSGTAVRALRPRPDGGTGVLFGGSSHEDVVDAVVLAGGVAASAELLQPPAPLASAALRGVPLGSTTVITLAYPADSFPSDTSGQGWLEADPAPISGVTVSSAKWPGRAPEGTVLLRAFVPDRVGASARAGDAAQISLVTEHVASALDFSARPLLSRVHRWTSLMPKYTVGHLGRVGAVEQGLARLPRWRVAGSALNGVGIPDCIADGRLAAQQVLSDQIQRDESLPGQTPASETS